MQDTEFSRRLGELERSLLGEDEDPLPTRDELARVRAALKELERDPATTADRARRAALDTVSELLGRVTGMVAIAERDAAG